MRGLQRAELPCPTLFASRKHERKRMNGRDVNCLKSLFLHRRNKNKRSDLLCVSNLRFYYRSVSTKVANQFLPQGARGLTDADGNIAQHVEYIPYGEVFVEERNHSFSTNYLLMPRNLTTKQVCTTMEPDTWILRGQCGYL